MKRMKKFLSLLLACMLMLNGTVLYAVGEEALPSETETAPDVALSDVVDEKYDAGDEIVEWREEGVKHYYLGDGKYQAVVQVGDMVNQAQSRSTSTTVNSSRYPLDTYLSSFYKDVCYGESDEVWVGSYYVGLFYNNKPTLPANAVIESATMHFSYYYHVSTGSMTVGAYAVEEYWDEYTVTWNEMDAYPDMGISTTASGTVTLAASSTNSETNPTRASVSITDIVRSWYSKERSNEGIALKRISGSNTSVILKSYESEDEDHYAYYTITYSTLDGNVVPKGEYYLQNAKFEKFAEIDDDASATTDGAIIEIWNFNAEADQKWNITYLYNGYYKIISTASGKALTAPTSTNASITQNVYTGTDKQLWVIKKNTDGTYKLSPKSNQSQYMAAGAGLITARGRNVEMREEQSDNRDDWEIMILYDATLVAIPAGSGHPHDASFLDVQTALGNRGYVTNRIVTEVTASGCSAYIATSKVFYSRSHGNTTAIQLNNETLTVTKINNLEANAFADCKLVVYGACLTGKGREGAINLVNATYAKGVTSVIGFELSVNCEEMNMWATAFFNAIGQGKSIEKACEAADAKITEDWDDIITTDSWYIAGSKNTVLN